MVRVIGRHLGEDFFHPFLLLVLCLQVLPLLPQEEQYTNVDGQHQSAKQGFAKPLPSARAGLFPGLGHEYIVDSWLRALLTELEAEHDSENKPGVMT